MNTKIEYIKKGDYYYPNLVMPPQPEEPLLKYGIMHRDYLKNHRRGIYAALRLKGTLKEHCLAVQHRAEERMDQLVTHMAEKEGVTEALKRKDPMSWLRKMENIRARAEEIVREGTIYTL